MTATDELRRMLDERGVEWEDGGEGLTIIPVQDGVPRAWTVNTWPSGKDMGDCLWVQNRHPLTPEQAIAATIGDVPHLPYFWTADGTLHVELPRLPESISVRLPNQRDREVGSARTWQYTRDNGTCKDVCNSVSEFTCSVCGFNCDLTSWISLFDGDDGRHRHHHHGTPNYCPNCGRKVVDE